MKRLFILVLFCITTNAYSQEFKLTNFKIKVNSSISSVAYFKDRFYCIESSKNIFYIDSLCNKIDITTTEPFISVTTSNDSLLFCTKNDSIFYLEDDSLFYFLRKGKITQPFYEDQQYLVEKTCSGEWGGSIYFTNKLNKKKYECSATCPIIVNKLNNSYIVTASLAHMSGLTTILRIDDPTNLTLLKRRNSKKTNYIGGNESVARKGAESLVSSGRAMTLTSFIYDNDVYHVVIEYDGTYLCKIIDNEFKEIIKISDEGFWSYNPINTIYENNKMLSFFQNHESNGFLFISDNNIKAYLFDNKK